MGKIYNYTSESFKKELNSYILKCFKKAFRDEGKEFNKSSFMCEWVVIEDSRREYHFYPFIKCISSKVLFNVLRQLKNNIEQRFGIHYKDTANFECVFKHTDIIDYAYTKFMFESKYGRLSLLVYDKLDNPELCGMTGDYMTSYVYEKLLFTYRDINGAQYSYMHKSDSNRFLPGSLIRDWIAFKRLYKDTFKEDIYKYNFICSDGLVVL